MCFDLKCAEAVGVAVSFGMVGWAVGAILRSIPALSRSTREAAAAMQDYALACIIFASLVGGTTAAFNAFMSNVVMPNLIGPNWESYCDDLINFYTNSWVKATALISVISGLAAALAFIPAVGTAISMAFTIAMAPALILLGAVILPTSVLNYVTVALFKEAGPYLFAAGVLAICVPNRLLKGLGGVLISFAVVFYAGLPYIPVAYQIIMKGKATPEEFGRYIDAYYQNMTSVEAKAGIFDQGIVTKVYGPLIDWAVMCLLTAILVAIVFACARGLAQSIGGVSASV